MSRLLVVLSFLASCSDVLATNTFVLASNGSEIFYIEEPDRDGDGRLNRISSNTTTTILLSGTGAPTQMVADSSGVFWSAQGNTLRATSFDGTVRILATSATMLPIAVDEVDVFWFGADLSSPPLLQATPKDGSGASRILTSAGWFVTSVTIVSQVVFWSEWASDTDAAAGGVIRQVGVDGTGAALFSQLASLPEGLVSDGQYVYWLEFGPDAGSIKRLAIGAPGGTGELIASFTGGLDSCFGCGRHDRLRMLGDTLFWSDLHTVHSISVTGGAATTVLDLSQDNESIDRFVVDEAFVYYLVSSGLHRRAR